MQTFCVRHFVGRRVLTRLRLLTSSSKGRKDGPEPCGLIVIVNAAVTSGICMMAASFVQLLDATDLNIEVFLQYTEEQILVSFITPIIAFARYIEALLKHT